MGFRFSVTSTIVSVVIMAIMWELSESGAIRSITGSFQGKIIASLFVVLIGTVIAYFLSGGK